MCVRLCALAGLTSMRTRARVRARASLSANLYLWLLAYSIYMHHICTKVHRVHCNAMKKVADINKLVLSLAP